MNPRLHRYRAFISYSHVDRQWGEWLHRALESYRVPQRLVGTIGEHGPIPRRLYPIFRDRDELPTAGVLGEVLIRALAASHSFILICSRAAARSRWVNEEVLQFKRLGGEARIYCLIVDGEPHATDPARECFPPALRHTLDADGELTDTPVELLAADVRDGGDGRDNARLKLVAGLLGIRLGELRQRDLQARNRRLGIFAGITTGVAALTLVLAVQAIAARRAAEKSRQQGEDLIAFMLGDLRSTLEPLGKLDILDAVGDKAVDYFDHLDGQSLTDTALASRAKALRQIGEVRTAQGRPDDAGKALDAALALQRQLGARHPDDAGLRFELGQTEYAAADAAYSEGDFDRAEAHLLARRSISESLVDRWPAESQWRLDLAQADNALGSLAHEHFNGKDAIDYFRRSMALASSIQPQTDRTHLLISLNLLWEGKSMQQRGRMADAVGLMEKSTDVLRKLMLEHPDDHDRQEDLSYGLQMLTFALIQSGEPQRAQATNAEAKILVNDLISRDSSNLTYQYYAIVNELNEASALFLQVRLSEAAAESNKAMAAIQRHAQDPPSWRYRLFDHISHELAFNLAMAQGRRDIALTRAMEEVRSDCVEIIAGTDKALMYCAQASLQNLELGNDVTGSRQTIDRVLARRKVLAEATEFQFLELRVKILDGRSAEALPTIRTLLGKHYRPLELLTFLRRHCDAILAQALGEGCAVAVD